MSDVLAKQPRPHGNRLAIVTNSGAAGVMATDKLNATGGTLAQPFRRRQCQNLLDDNSSRPEYLIHCLRHERQKADYLVPLR